MTGRTNLESQTVHGAGRVAGPLGLASLLLASTVLGCAWFGAAGLAQAQQVSGQASSGQVSQFSIPAQPLSSAINAFIRQTGWQISYSSALANGKTSGPVSGAYTPAQALQRLVAGTGTNIRISGAGSAALVDAGVAASGSVNAGGSVLLDTITVLGGGQGRTGTLGTLADEDANFRTAGSSAFLSQQTIERFRGSSVGDFIKGTPGVLTGDNRNSGAVDVNVRGMQGFGRVPVVVDGTMQQNTVYRGYSGVASRNYVDPDMIGGVVIEKGPSASVYGVGATGGLVRMETINASDIIKGDRNWGVRLKGGVMGNMSTPPAIGTPGGYAPLQKSRFITGCNYTCTVDTIPDNLLSGSPHGLDRPAFLDPKSGSGSVAFAGRNDMFEVTAAYTKRNNGNYYAGTRGRTPVLTETTDRIIRPGRLGRPDQITDYAVFSLNGLNRYRAGEEVLNTSQNNTSYLLKSKLELDGGHTFDASYMRYHSLFGEMMPSVILRFDGATQAELSEVSVDTYRAGYRWNPDENGLINFKSNIWMTDTDTHIRTPYAFSFLGGGVMQVPQAYWDIAKRYGVDAVNTSEFDTKWGDFELAFGGSFVYETIEPPKGHVNVDSNNLLASRDGWRKEASAFTAGEWKPTDWLKLDAALRYTWTQSYDNNTNYGSVLHNEEKNSGWAPMVGATLEPWDGVQFYAKYSEAIRSPSLFESTTGFSFSPNPLVGVRPERSRNTEIGINILHEDLITGGDKVRFKASYFNNNVTDYLTRSNFPNVSVRNIEKALFRGFEASVGYDIGWGYVDVSGIIYDKTEFCSEELRIGVACRSSGVQNGYAQLHLPPRKSATVTGGVRLLDNALDIGGRVSYIGDRGTMTSDETGGYTTVVNWEKYTLVDLFASYKVNENVNIDFAVDNVTDIYYMDALTLGLMPSPGRTFRLNMTAKF